MTSTLKYNDAYIKLLSILSIGDTSHDFKGELGDMNINTEFKNPKFKNMYCSSLFEPCEKDVDLTSFTEDKICQNAFKEKRKDTRIYNIDEFKFAPSLKQDLDIDFHDKNKPRQYFIDLENKLKEIDDENCWFDYELITKNDFKYNVKGSVVLTENINNKKKYKNGAQVINELDIDDSIIIIDTQAIGLFNIFLSGDPDSNPQKKIHYVYTREATNDPANKTLPFKIKSHNEIFNKRSNVKIHALSDEIIDYKKNDKYNIYNFKHHQNNDNPEYYKKINNYNLFYTKYDFKLSYINKLNAGFIKTIDTTLDISDPLKQSNSTVRNSTNNNFNKISVVSKLLLTAFDKFKKKSAYDLIFEINSLFQRKRSGDWLQVLSCKDVHNRDLIEYVSNVQGNRSTNLISQQLTKEKKTEYKNKNVYFVTIDKIALTYALINGINCIYTHDNTSSYYSFTLSSDNKINKQENDKQKYINKLNIIIEFLSKYSDYNFFYQNIIELINKYIIFYNYNTAYFTNIIDKIIKKIYITSNLDILRTNERQKVNIDVENFTKYIRLLFKACYEYSLFLNTYPLFNNDYVEINNIFKEIIQSDIITTFNGYSTIDEKKDFVSNPDNIILINDIFDKYTFLQNNVLKIEKIKDLFYKNSVFINRINLKKSVNYRSIDLWDWNKRGIADRLFDFYKELRNLYILDKTRTYKSVMNGFLYDITNLPKRDNQNIVYLFFLLYDKIFKNLNEITKAPENIINELNDFETIRFYPFIRNFCIEVFISLGCLFDITTPINNKNTILDLINEYVSKNIKSNIDPLMTDTILIDQMQSLNSDYRENIIISPLLNQELIENIIENEYYGYKKIESEEEIISKERKIIIDSDKLNTIKKYKRNVIIDFTKLIKKNENEETQKTDEIIKNELDILRNDIINEPINSNNIGKINKINYVISRSIEEAKRIFNPFKLKDNIISLFRINKEIYKEEPLDSFLTINKSTEQIGGIKRKNDAEDVTNISDIEYDEDYDKEFDMEYDRDRDREHRRVKQRGIENVMYNQIITDNKSEYIIKILLSNLLLVNNYTLRIDGDDEGLIEYYLNYYSSLNYTGPLLSGGENTNYKKFDNDVYKNDLNKSIIGSFDNNIFILNEYFHPLLPLYLMLYSLYNQDINYNINDNNEEESDIDYTLFISYYLFIKELSSKLIEHCDTNNIKKQIISYLIGFGLKELLFTSDINTLETDSFKFNEIYFKCDRQLWDDIYSYSDTLSSYIIGLYNQKLIFNKESDIDVESKNNLIGENIISDDSNEKHRKFYLKNKYFMEFINDINYNDIFTLNGKYIDYNNHSKLKNIKDEIFNDMNLINNKIKLDKLTIHYQDYIYYTNRYIYSNLEYSIKEESVIKREDVPIKTGYIDIKPKPFENIVFPIMPFRSDAIATAAAAGGSKDDLHLINKKNFTNKRRINNKRRYTSKHNKN